MNWECKYCKIIFEFEKPQQKGAHITNCDKNPKRSEIKEKAKINAAKVLAVPKTEIKKMCPTCSNEFIQFVSQSRIDRNDIREYCSRGCFNRRNISDKTRLKLSLAALANENDPSYVQNRIEGYKKSFADKRAGYQEKGKIRVKLNDSLYIAGCMLYWGEGSKSINTAQLTNSDSNLLLLFKKFLYTFWDVNDANIILSINCYTDLHSVEEIEKYWISKLSLSKSNLRKTMINKLPISSTNSKKNKLEYGTARLTVNKTEIVQEIYGAIQEFGGGFFYEHWINHAA